MTELSDCSHVLARLHEFHDHEISDAEAAEIRAHLLACEPCLDRYDLEEALRVLIRRCCASERAPESLRTRVRASFGQTTVVITESTQG